MTSSHPRTVLVVGDIMMDVLVTMSSEIIRGSDVPSVVETGFGGTASNVAAWLGYQKHPVRLLGVVGDDVWGHEIIKNQLDWGVDVRLRVNADLPTGAVVVLNHPDGERSMFPDTRANQSLNLENLPEDLWLDVCVLYMSGYTLLTPSTRAAAVSLMTAARERGVKVCLDPASVGPLQKVDPAELTSWLKLCDVVLPNELELLALTHQTDTQGRLQELSETVEVVVAKLGPQGAIWAQAGTQTQQPAQVVEVVDTVGAGDAFAAGLLAALADARSVHESLLNATAIAALAVAKRGAQPELS